MTQEQWRPIKGYPNYAVSDMGRVYSLPRSGVRGGYLCCLPNHGYQMAVLYRSRTDPRCRFERKGRRHYVHHLVLEAFDGPRPRGMEADHDNGIRTDNRIGNLAWATHRDNMKRKEQHGTILRGERCPWAKLTASLVLAIRRSPESVSALAERHGVTPSNIVAIQKQKSWRHV